MWVRAPTSSAWASSGNIGDLFVYVDTSSPIEVHLQVDHPSVEGLRAHTLMVSARMQERAHLLPHQGKVYVVQINRAEFRQAGPAVRRVLADWMKAEADLIRACSLGVGFVIDSVLIRGALIAVFWLASMDCYRVHANVDEAVSSAVRVVAEAGLLVPSALRTGGSAAVQTELKRALAAALPGPRGRLSESDGRAPSRVPQ